MKLISDYLEQSMQFQRMADEAADPGLRIQLRQQAESYYRLAAKRAKAMGIAIPDEPKSSGEAAASR